MDGLVCPGAWVPSDGEGHGVTPQPVSLEG